MAKYDWNTFRNYIAFLAGELAPGTRHPHHDSEWSSCYHDAFLPWGHYHNNIVLFYHDSPITRSHFMDPTDRAIKGFYCMCFSLFQQTRTCLSNLANMLMVQTQQHPLQLTLMVFKHTASTNSQSEAMVENPCQYGYQHGFFLLIQLHNI